MSRRIYWLVPDVASAQQVLKDLLLARITERQIHFVGRDGMDLSGLPTANILQTSDVVRAAQMGLVVGGATGAAAGVLAAVWFPIVGDTAQWGIAAVLAMIGGGFGAWAASMIGVSTPSGRLRRFEGAIEQGQILLMVDVPASRVKEIEELLGASHPEAKFEGEEPNIPAFP